MYIIELYTSRERTELHLKNNRIYRRKNRSICRRFKTAAAVRGMATRNNIFFCDEDTFQKNSIEIITEKAIQGEEDYLRIYLV